jgi:ElaB/YqjD/DUF883 family membrane-anchored ribosome-binding protein
MDRTRETDSGENVSEAVTSAGQAAATAVQRVGDGLEQRRAALADMTERARECMQTTDTYVRDNPWQAVGIAAGLGLVVGLLVSRR